MTFREILENQLKRHEGFRAFPYLDTVGKTTIGYGRNLSDVGVSIEEAENMLEYDMEKAIAAAEVIFDEFDSLNDVRKAVLANMAFNLGQAKLAKFHDLIKAVSSGDYKEAAKQMLDSKWANQTGKRATELAKMMESGNEK